MKDFLKNELENHLKLNPSKRKMTIFCRPKDDTQYLVNKDGDVIHSDIIKSLDVPLDKHLTMSKMVSKIMPERSFVYSGYRNVASFIWRWKRVDYW